MASTNVTNSSQSSIIADSRIQLQIDSTYIFMGAMAILANAFVFVILLSDRLLLRKSAFIFAISLSHLLGSIHMCFSGAYRVVWHDYLNDRISTWMCVAQVWTLFYSMEFQTMGILLMLVGIERLIAVYKPAWYRMNWTSRVSWHLAGGAFVVGFCGLTWALYNVSQIVGTQQRRCQQGAVYGTNYAGYFSGISSIGGTVACLATLLAMLEGKRRFSKMTAKSQQAQRMDKQLQLTRTMLTVAFLDFFLTIPPNFALFLNKVNPSIPFNEYLPYFSNIAYSVNGVANIVAYLAFNREFRSATISLLRGIGMKFTDSNVIQPGTSTNRASLARIG